MQWYTCGLTSLPVMMLSLPCSCVVFCCLDGKKRCSSGMSWRESGRSNSSESRDALVNEFS